MRLTCHLERPKSDARATGRSARLDGALATVYRRAMRLVGICLLAATATSCTIPTWGVVRRFEGDRFRACRIEIGWWVQELVNECGEPTWVRRRVGPDGRNDMVCAGYSSAAVAGAVGEIAAPQVVACLNGAGRKTRTAPTLESSTNWLIPNEQAKSLSIREVFLVSEGPPDVEGSAR